jgi:endonuclease/exonuclease/phosphatase family metal-dependent hydrolase
MNDHKFKSCINDYTRVQKSKSCIDHIFVINIKTANFKSYVKHVRITDHFATSISVNTDNKDKVIK